MFVGPFFYLNLPRISQKGLYADLLSQEHANRTDQKLISPVTHQELMDRLAKGGDYSDIPRGSVVFDLDSQQAIIYIDRCLEKYVDDIVRLFELPQWVIEYDEEYICPRCDHLSNRF